MIFSLLNIYIAQIFPLDITISHYKVLILPDTAFRLNLKHAFVTPQVAAVCLNTYIANVHNSKC